MFWKKNVSKKELGVALAYLALSLHNREAKLFDSIYNCSNLSKEYRIRCSWETTYFYISLMLIYVLAFLPSRKSGYYKDLFTSYWEEYDRFLMLGDPSTEEYEYHIASTQLRYDVYGDIGDEAIKNKENIGQEIAHIFLKAIRYIKLTKIDDIDMESFFETNIDELKQNITEEEGGGGEYFNKNNPHNIALQNIQADMIENIKKLLKKFKIV